ncbi:hypothetical protein PPL_09215 [Heterostelium album PN500]|uniref:FCP1 homology domain-containing protein n=1 Tax=Heterostelium pallidum (strain ATCC 26659 / Pp 5 / PN500) TaxID=670386 RepID=D3BKY3_HETP5|nr:hypothetical protein PPL_09215 [Heterostelium album PN500]EFA78563.1 hypothetical protein PPL_09215 [Heterostelium album PN500]|eukprot:XP_020430687.1 hypothetical protein PPL_09215 [Heterostelium album PN500]
MEPLDCKFQDICTSIQSPEEEKSSLESFKTLSIKDVEISKVRNSTVPNPMTTTPTTVVSSNHRSQQKTKSNHGHSEKNTLSKKSKKKLKNLFLSFLICYTDNNIYDDCDSDSENQYSIYQSNNNKNTSTNNGPVDEPNRRGVINDQIIIVPNSNQNNNSSNNKHSKNSKSKQQPLVNVIDQLPKIEYLLSPQSEEFKGKKTIVIDLDETLVHSYFKPTSEPDIILPIEMDNGVVTFYINKRPYVQELFDFLHGKFEIVIFTASISRYADKVLDLIDPNKVISSRLFRESCYHHKGNYIKDLSRLGRDLRNTIIVDNSPHAYFLHPENAIPITSWFCDKTDHQLLDLISLLEKLMHCTDVRNILDGNTTGWFAKH